MFSKININKSKQGNPIASDPLRLNSVNQQQLKEKTLILLKSLKLLKPIITVKWETDQRKLIEWKKREEREREREREHFERNYQWAADWASASMIQIAKLNASLTYKEWMGGSVGVACTAM